jgi:hypothetical protein
MLLHRAVALVPLLFVGCSSVKSTALLGEPLDAERTKAFEGVWLAPEGEPLVVKHVGQNELRVATVDWDEDQFKIEQAAVFLGEDEERLYANLVELDELEEAPNYAIAAVIAADDDYLLLVGPNVDAFEKAIAAGALAGTVERQQYTTEVQLTSSAEQLNKFVDPALAGSQFELDAPLVLHRVQQFKEEAEGE